MQSCWVLSGALLRKSEEDKQGGAWANRIAFRFVMQLIFI